MNEQLKAQEAKVIALLFNALEVLVCKLEDEKKINKKSEVLALEEAVHLCHKIRSLLPLA